MSQKEVTKNNLTDAFWELYKEKPLSKITVKEITDKAGYNRGTFYTYFTDTYEIQRLIRESVMPDKDMILTPLMNLDPDSRDIFATLDRTNDYFKAHSDKISVLVGPEGDPSFIHELKMRIRGIIMEYVYETGINEPEKIEYIIEYQLSALIGLFQFWIEREDEIDEEALATLMEDVCHKGVSTLLESMFQNKSK